MCHASFSVLVFLSLCRLALIIPVVLSQCASLCVPDRHPTASSACAWFSICIFVLL